MEVRFATVDDLPQIAAHGEQFWQMTPPATAGMPYDYESIMELLLELGSTGYLKVAMEGDEVAGFVAAAVYPCPFNKNFVMANELFFYVRPESRNTGVAEALLGTMEEELKEAGVDYMNMVQLETSMPTEVKQFYDNRGYQLCENIYSKVL